MRVEITEPGLSTTVQDLGRDGFYNVGIPPGGALDRRSARLANLLVGNPPGAAVLEATYLGPKLAFSSAATVAVTGGTAQVFKNGEEVCAWESVRFDDGDVLSFGFIQAGARLYIAVAGGFNVPSMLGSRSTYVLGGLGGFNGRTLVAGDELETGPMDTPFQHRAVPAADRPTWSRQLEPRIVFGLNDYRLTKGARRAVVEADWALTPVADRAGLRFSGPTLDFIEREQPFGAGSDPSNIVDAGYPIGSIQIPSGSELIVLHRDAVSGGGYAMIATVISVDMDAIGQAAPGSNVRFRAVSLDEAIAARHAAQADFKRVAASLADSGVE